LWTAETNLAIQICGFCIKTTPIKDITHGTERCQLLAGANKKRGNFPPISVENGLIEWVDREPTPDPEEVTQRALKELGDKLDLLVKRQDEILGLLRYQPKAEGSKPSKKKAKIEKVNKE